MAKAPIKELLFGRLALGGRLVTDEQIAECLELQRKYEEQGGPVPRLGELLAMKGYMTADQVKAVLEGQHSRREGLFGEIALRWRLITQQDLDQALDAQRGQDGPGARRQRLGEVLVERGLLRPHQVRAILDAQGKRIVRCSGCDARFNVAQFRAGARLVCAKCGTVTVLGETERPVAEDSPLDVQHTVRITAEEQARIGETPGSGVFPGAGDDAAAGSGLHTALQIGGFEVLSRLGSDGVSTLCKARSLSTGDLVTLKIMRPRGAVDEKFLESFRDNSKQAIYLDHPGLKRVYEVGSDRGRYFVAEEYVEGRSLKRHLETVGRMTPAEAVDFAAQLAEALACGHGRGIVHGDVRPSNVVIDRSGRARLSGLGVAKDAVLTLNYLGKDAPNTPFYLAPEAAVDPARVDARSDVYSLGACLYHMITGRPPYIGQGSLEVLMRLTQEEPVPPEQIVPELPAALCRLVMQMLAAEPDERPQTVEEVLAALRQLAAKLGPVKSSLAETAGTGAGTGLGTGTGTGMGRGKGSGRRFAAASAPRPAPAATGDRRAHQLAPRSAGGSRAAVNTFLVVFVVVVVGSVFWIFSRQKPPDEPRRTPGTSQRPDVYRPPLDVQPMPDPRTDPAGKLYGEAMRYAEDNVGDDKVIAARFKEIVAKYPNSVYGNRYAADKYVKYLGQAAGRDLDALERARSALEDKGDFKASLAAYEAWRRDYAGAADDVLARGRRTEGAILAAQRAYLEKRFKEADALAAGGDYDGARKALDGLRGSVSPEGAAYIAERIAEFDKRQLATADAATRQRLEAERLKREAEELRAREEKTRQLAEQAARLRPEVAELVGRRDFGKVRETIATFRKEAAGTDHLAAAAEIEEVAGLCAEFHKALAAAASAGGPEALIRFDGKPRQIMAADEQAVTLDLGNNVHPRLPWDNFAGADICELARPFVPRDNGRMMLAYAVYAAALGQDAEAARYLELAGKNGVRSPAASAAAADGWLLTAKERKRRAEEAARLAERAETLRAEAASALAEWNFARARESFAAAGQELAGSVYEARMAQADEAVGLLSGYHGVLVAALKARKGNPTIKYHNRARSIAAAGATGVTLDIDGVPTKLPWCELSPKELGWLALNHCDQKDPSSLAGCALFLDMAGDVKQALDALDMAEKAGLRSGAARAAIEGQFLLTIEEKKRRADEARQLDERFARLCSEVAALAVAGDFEKAQKTLDAAKEELAGSDLAPRRARLEEATVLAMAFHKVFMAGLKSGKSNARLNYAGQPRRVTGASATGVTLDVEDSTVPLAWSLFPAKEVCALARASVNQKDGASLLGYALFCSLRGESAEALRALADAEKAGSRSAAARAAIEGKWLEPPAADKQ